MLLNINDNKNYVRTHNLMLFVERNDVYEDNTIILHRKNTWINHAKSANEKEFKAFYE